MVRRISKEYLSQEASVLTPDFLIFLDVQIGLRKRRPFFVLVLKGKEHWANKTKQSFSTTETTESFLGEFLSLEGSPNPNLPTP